jgi:SAM-dependent methyltransferase
MIRAIFIGGPMIRSDVNAHFFPEINVEGFSRFDGTVQFYQRVNSILRPDAVVLDYGAGRGVAHIEDPVRFRRQLVRIQGKVGKVVGADIDPIVTTNPALDAAVVLDKSGRLPLADRSINIILSDHTFEHIEDPASVTREFDRVLTPGGWICARTPNRYGYIAFLNRIIPKSVSKKAVSMAQPGRKEEDIFPAFYRLNSQAALRKHFDPARYDHFSYTWDSEPAYHFSSHLVYGLMLFAHAISPPPLKAMRYIFIQKKPI